MIEIGILKIYPNKKFSFEKFKPIHLGLQFFCLENSGPGFFESN